ncbi:PREDICTED: uncharacterized protein LOC108761620 [Trachymyrmex cornetzi]|uniref:uncharacterized protein LOC108761620 n=1 Tax=Trachymyrmex cornetzi TaxID=471704 RepID=UPI00084F1FB5|nr:PREDICTED: uncharacterized protein LOC108761620 [Trachymyrmex cornetzi]
MVPFDLEADRLRRSYLRRRQIIADNGVLLPRERDNIIKVERQRSLWRWREQLVQLPASGPGALVRGAVAEHLERWVDRGHGALTYRTTQVLTGHGVFESYLFRIGQRVSPICNYCRAAADTSMHTLLFCPAWAEQRGEILEIIGVDRTYGAVVRAIVLSEKVWAVFMTFCERVMRKKEEDERARERGIIRAPVDALVPQADTSDREE